MLSQVPAVGESAAAPHPTRKTAGCRRSWRKLRTTNVHIYAVLRGTLSSFLMVKRRRGIQASNLRFHGFHLSYLPSRKKGSRFCMANNSSASLSTRVLLLGFPGLETIRQVSRVASPFLSAVFSRQGMLSKEGRTLIRGKIRRLLICSVPLLPDYLRAHYRLEGACNSCGASCNLLFRCPHWDVDSRLCTVYHSRPKVCRMFPITPSDLRDRNLASRHAGCGYHFAGEQ